jgi:hypothetical protein
MLIDKGTDLSAAFLPLLFNVCGLSTSRSTCTWSNLMPTGMLFGLEVFGKSPIMFR